MTEFEDPDLPGLNEWPEEDTSVNWRPGESDNECDTLAEAQQFHKELMEKEAAKTSAADVEMNHTANRDWELLVQKSRQTLSSSATAGLLYPWQKGFAAKVFTNSGLASSFNIPTPRLLEPPSQSSDPKQEITSDIVADRLRKVPSAWTAVSHRISGLTFHNTDDSKRQAA